MEKLTNIFKIEYVKGDTYAFAIKFKNITEDLKTAFLTVKENPDDEPLIQKSLGQGIDKIDDRAYKNEKTYKFQLQPADTVYIEPKVQYLYDVQVAVGTVVKTVLHGVFVLNSTITGTKQLTTPTLEVEIDDELETELATTPATNGVEYEQDPVACGKIGNLLTLSTTNKETVVKAVNEVKANATTNAEEINKIKNGTIELPSAKNVSETINGKNITDIFEEDGATVKNSTTAQNITSQINGKNISDIFEEDGATVKNSTTSESATNDSDGNEITSTYVKTSVSEYIVDIDSTYNRRIQVSKQGKIVVLNISGKNFGTSAIDETILTLNDGYRPKFMQSTTCNLIDENGASAGVMQVNIFDNGRVNVYCKTTSSITRYLYCNMTFVTN